MTEQERPRTEAGRRMLTGIQDTSERLDVALNALDYILAIEAEGRQQAVRAIEAEIRRDAEDFDGYGADWMRQRILNHRIPAAVAGLNASESGQPPEASDE